MEAARSGWIVGRSYDLTYFIGSTLSSPLLALVFVGLVFGLGLHVLEGAFILYFFFTLFFDSPHIFQTFSRTHADPIEFRRQRSLHVGLLPAIIVACLGLFYYGYYLELSIFFQVFGAWHIVRQNIGFLKLYGRRGAESGATRYLDLITYYSVWAACLLHTPKLDFRDQTIDSALNNVLYSLADQFPILMTSLEWGSMGLTIACMLLSLANTLVGYLRTGVINVPKLLFMWITVANYFFVFVFLRQFFVIPVLAIVAFETVYHDIQYHGFVARYQRARHPQTPDIARKWFLAGIIYAAIIVFIQLYFIEWEEYSEIIYMPIMAVVLWHYYIDGRIWRFGTSPELQNVFGGAHHGAPSR